MAFYHYIAQRQVQSEWAPLTNAFASPTATGTETTSGTLEATDVGLASGSTGQEESSTSSKEEGADGSTTEPTQTETTAAASTNTLTNSPNPGLKGGEVAGVAIGCLAAGLIIGIIFGWFLCHAMRRSKHRKGGHGSEDRAKMLSQPKDDVPVALEPLGKNMKLENVILQPASDSKIVSDLGRLEDIIRQHVEAVYHSGPVDVEVVTLANTLTNLGISKKSSGFDAETVAGWCLQPGTRRGALQHVISHVLFRSIDWNSPGPLTLLPKPAVDFLHSIRPVREYRDNFDVMSFAWTRWRTLSALFLHPAPNERTPLELSEPDVQDQAEVVAKALDSVLHFFVAPDQESRRKQRDHLHVMIIDAAKLGYVLFSHTSDWRFVYKGESRKEGAVVCVGLEKLSGPDGRRLSSPQRIAEPRLLS
ncbi:hypothetical protein CDV31_009956 [Fusarium ambrosium]|uniref:Uncharacterized protein n=1 Tax=Fusarium ambrosium TaxID=131363 RepID=A0A428TRI5_9HYPO|nr:hypothetical protein CDV31_009956 [Fusarium ambrosium]